MKLIITVQKARDGRDYVQIMSDDQITTNIVLIAEEISIVDLRKGAK
jgi:hypothetical protein